VGYKDSQLLKESLFVIANSSRIQEESTFLGISCLTVRENTEHPITIARGTNTLVGRNSEKIIDEALLILDGKGKRGIIPELWDGKTAERILEVLRCRADGVTP
jgi:UDP-N-acetylglucosamine 2-epimerase (non-hydrolysing)